MAGLRLLSVNAHPHDFTHYSGTLGIHVADGDSVTVVVMSRRTSMMNATGILSRGFSRCH